MAVESLMLFGSTNSKKAKKAYQVVDCRVVLNREFNQYSPTSATYLESLEVTVSPAPDDSFLHKWYMEKTLEDVYIGIILLDDLTGVENGYHNLVLENAVCCSLTECAVKVSKKGDGRRRLLKVGINAPKVAQSKPKKQETKVNQAAPIAPIQQQAQPQFPREYVNKLMSQMPDNLTDFEKRKLAEHSILLSQALGIPKGKPMTIEEADEQKANPHYVPKTIPNDGTVVKPIKTETVMEEQVDANGNKIQVPKVITPKYVDNPQYVEAEHRKFSYNCATCSCAYALRLQGFDVKAKGNPQDKSGSLNVWLSKEDHVFQVWKNADGTPAKPVYTKEWMENNGLSKMTPEQYRRFVDENTKEEGVYIFAIGWPGEKGSGSEGQNDGGHATILQKWRDKDGVLHLNRIEPQVFGDHAKRSPLALYKGISPWPGEKHAIMRVDNKLFDTKYIKLFEV